MRMASQLLVRQTSLLEHLTSGAAIFGDAADASLDRDPLGINAGLLRLEARFSHEKRMEKIKWVLPRALDLLGTAQAAVVRDFVEACPPASISWLDNARQFHAFLLKRWLLKAPEPPYLPDVAACELAYASIHGSEKQAFEAKEYATFGGIRRHPCVVLVRCSYDVRSILEERTGEAGVAKRDTPLAMSMPPGAEHPTVSELSPDLFELLEMLDDFVDLEEFSDVPDVNELIADLGRRGFLEVRP
jgi:hypothetical protein